MYPIVFLDIDGVLNARNVHELLDRNPELFLKWRRGDVIEIQKLELLRQFCAVTQAKVVIISSWATNYDKLLSITNFLQLPIIDKIDYTGGGTARGQSVLKFIYRNQITNYIILDDSWDFYDSNNSLLQPHLVKIDGAVGLTQDNISNAHTIIKVTHERY